MQRADFHKIFQCSGPVILPVIHVLDDARTATNIDHIIDAGLKGCFLINHDFGIDAFLPVLEAIEAGIRISDRGEFPCRDRLESLSDSADLDERGVESMLTGLMMPELTRVPSLRKKLTTSPRRARLAAGRDSISAAQPSRTASGRPEGLRTRGRLAGGFMDVVTTSGIATGHFADLGNPWSFVAP